MATATMAGCGIEGHRMEEKKLEYFSSINSMARKIMQEREHIKQTFGAAWENMSPTEQDSAIDNGMMDPQIRARYAMHRVERDEVVCYPKLLIQTGQKIVHFGDEDLTWQDEHSAPFSWETKSQLEFSLTATGPEHGSREALSTLADSKPAKASQGSQPVKTPQGTKAPNGDSLGRREESSSFWKISAARSRLDGEKADFHSLTPSQIKSLEKGEKPLPSYLRQEPPPREVDETPRPAKQRGVRPPTQQPPPVPVAVATPSVISLPAVTPPPSALSVSPAPLSVSSTVAGWERAQSTLPSVGAQDDNFTPGLVNKASLPPLGAGAKESEGAESALAGSPTFAQYNTSNNILKTGFDFLDNW